MNIQTEGEEAGEFNRIVLKSSNLIGNGDRYVILLTDTSKLSNFLTDSCTFQNNIGVSVSM